MKKRALIVSDTHYCHVDWYGVDSAERMRRLMRHINEEYEKDPFEVILFLGDLSLDHWRWQTKGCYLKEGRSRTGEFVKEFCPELPDVPVYMIAGNHEQYGEEMWRSLTGCGRSAVVPFGDVLLVLYDSYCADLDPTEHSDGTYTPIPVAQIRAVMDAHPDKRIVLASHHFDIAKEGDEARELLLDPRVLCLFCGHSHAANVTVLPEEWGEKRVIRTGNYSYYGKSDRDILQYMWGFRDLYLDEGVLWSRYIVPENEVVLDGERVQVPAAYQNGVEIRF